jgi:thiamine pyrophosphokinase
VKAIVFIGGEGPTSERCKILLGKEPAPLILAADSGLVAAEAAGYHPDWIVGDMDSLPDISCLSRYPEEKILRYPVDKDYTDTELALQLARKQGVDEIWLLGGGGGRLDHTLAIVALFDRPGAPQRWYTRNEDVYFLESEIILSVSIGTLISIFPAGTGPWKISGEGLKWPINEIHWYRGFFGLSNRATYTSIRFTAEQGTFLIIVPFQ